MQNINENQLLNKRKQVTYKYIAELNRGSIQIVNNIDDQKQQLESMHIDYQLHKKQFQDYVNYKTIFHNQKQQIQKPIEQIGHSNVKREKNSVQNKFKNYFLQNPKIKGFNLSEDFWNNEIKFPKKANAQPFIYKNKRRNNINQQSQQQSSLENSDEISQNNINCIQVKQEEEEQSQQKCKKQKTNNFPNKNKLFINEILRFFDNNHNISQIQFPNETIKQDLITFFKNIRQSGKKFSDNNKILKSDLFYHSHFIIMFLHIQKDNIDHLIQNEKDQEIFEKVMGKKLEKSDLESEEIQYLNFLKYCCFYLLKNVLISKYFSQFGYQNQEKNYEIRAYNGILQMFTGKMLQRF